MYIYYFKILAQVVIALSIYNVWFLRFNKSTKYRGKDASDMKQEFISYGLPASFVWVVGFLKVSFATMLLVRIFPTLIYLVFPAACGMAFLMLGAVAMHLKVKDPFIKSLPALIFMGLSLLIACY
jgi:hypothetical protein